MDQALFEQGKAAYEAQDFRTAARSFLGAAGDDPAGAGEALHCAGNALMRLNRYDDAATAYEHALEDDSYGKVGYVAANLGAAYRSAGRYDDAVDAYDLALKTPGYGRPWKAYQGRAGALYEMGKLDEAAGAYRAAALEPDNPDAGVSLNNLGLCHMALGRPADAVEAYEAALAMDGYGGRGRASANRGLALSVMGRHDDAVAAFRRANDEFGFELTGGLAEAYRVSIDAVASDSAALQPEPAATASDGETGLFEDVEPLSTDFFTRTDAEMREMDRETRREERRETRTSSGRAARVIAIVVVVAAAVGAIAWAYLAGYGYPTQQATVAGLMEAHASGGATEEYWVAVPASDIGKEMGKLPPNYTSYEVDSVDAGASTSLVDVTVELEGGAPLHYEFSMTREGVGWKLSGIENDWRSTGGGS